MSQNWMRHFELQIVSESGNGISLSDFKVVFNINWTVTRWPAVGTIKIYNLSGDTASRILGKEFAKIKIIAGYDGLAQDTDASQVGVVTNLEVDQVGQVNGTNFGEIFSGDIRYTLTGRDGPTDTWVLIQAVDGHEAFTNACVIKTLSAGYKVADIQAALMHTFNPFGVTQGTTGDFPETVFPRGRVLYHPARDVMDNVAGQCSATWQLAGGQLQMVPVDKYVRDPIVLNSDTGMIGMPQQTMEAGINVRCLINPNIRINGLIQIDQNSVYRASLSADKIASLAYRVSETLADGEAPDDVKTYQPAGVAADGIYIVYSIDYSGDTRGQDWYMDIMCRARNNATLQIKAVQ